METIGIVLSVGPDHVTAFEAGFSEHELPVWRISGAAATSSARR